MLKRLARIIGKTLAHYLVKPLSEYKPFSVSDQDTLREFLRPADILLVEGNQRVSTAIKYLTQSTWSHAAIYVGDALGSTDDGSE